uniref:Immunoglobulin V-set domain-containing protein n=1 Tax=Takifugu rubripes TaxID=31033 RepID=A0A3B5KAK4_TAKRU
RKLELLLGSPFAKDSSCLRGYSESSERTARVIKTSSSQKPCIDVKDQYSLNIKRGLFQTDDIFSTNENKWAISKEFKSRLEFDIQAFPSVNITINNLTIEDTGPYWCIYTKVAKNRANNYGNISPNSKHFSRGERGWLRLHADHTKSRKATRTISNDVYEDMRGTLRR